MQNLHFRKTNQFHQIIVKNLDCFSLIGTKFTPLVNRTEIMAILIMLSSILNDQYLLAFTIVYIFSSASLIEYMFDMSVRHLQLMIKCIKND